MPLSLISIRRTLASSFPSHCCPIVPLRSLSLYLFLKSENEGSVEIEGKSFSILVFVLLLGEETKSKFQDFILFKLFSSVSRETNRM